jgi:predicted nucleic acid-binding protein
MRLALTDLFKAHWTDRIHNEWINALMRTQKHSRESLLRAKDLMDQHVRDAKVFGYEPLIEGLNLPDPDDRHVLAAAIRCNANAIVTFNLKDFPTESLHQYDIEVIHPDDFILYQIDLAPTVCCRAFQAQRSALRNPPLNVDTFLATLQKQQLPQTVSKLREFSDFL